MSSKSREGTGTRLCKDREAIARTLDVIQSQKLLKD